MFEFSKLPREVNAHIHSYVEGQTIQDNFAKVLEDIKESHDCMDDDEYNIHGYPFEAKKHWMLYPTLLLGRYSTDFPGGEQEELCHSRETLTLELAFHDYYDGYRLKWMHAYNILLGHLDIIQPLPTGDRVRN